MAQRDYDYPGEEQRFPVRARRMERPIRDEGVHRGEQGRPGHGSFGAERGYEPGSYDWKLERMEARRGPGRPPRGYQRSDDRIREDVCERLMEGPVDVGDVEVTVSNGEVTLSGTVEERWEKRAIEDIAAHVRGVHDIHNRVRVRPQEDRPAAREPSKDVPGQQQPHMGT
jgi:hypothetical protein